MTQELAQIAFEFCRECLRWESPTASKQVPVIYYDKRPYGEFYYTNLSSVMEAVRGWCELNTASVLLQWTPFAVGENKFNACVSFPTTSKIGVGIDESPCLALLTACVEANRKLKEYV